MSLPRVCKSNFQYDSESPWISITKDIISPFIPKGTERYIAKIIHNTKLKIENNKKLAPWEIHILREQKKKKDKEESIKKANIVIQAD